MDVNQYLEIFLDETNEHLQSLADQLMILENEPENQDVINEIFRAAHSLKGMAGTMGYKRMQNLTHDMENVFSEVRNGNMKVSSGLIDVLFKALDALEEYKNIIQETADEGTNDNAPIISELNRILDEGLGKAPEAQATEEAPAAETKADDSPAGDKKWNDIKLGETEVHVLSEASAKDMHVYGITVFIQESCILKAARAFLVFKAIEELGEMIVSSPSTQDIEDEKFDFDFSMYVISAEGYDKVQAAIMSVSEIERCVGEEIDPSSLVSTEEDDKASEEKTTEVAEVVEEKPKKKTTKKTTITLLQPHGENPTEKK